MSDFQEGFDYFFFGLHTYWTMRKSWTVETKARPKGKTQAARNETGGRVMFQTLTLMHNQREMIQWIPPAFHLSQEEAHRWLAAPLCPHKLISNHAVS